MYHKLKKYINVSMSKLDGYMLQPTDSFQCFMYAVTLLEG
jgi:hypothetical protein